MGEDVFDDPSRWRLAAVRNLGLEGDDRIAGVVTGAAYPDALTPIVDALRARRGVVCDVGAGLGGASQWISSRSMAQAVAIEPEATSARAAAGLFPDLDVVLGAATALPVGDGRCAGVTLLGVVSLLDDLEAVLTEVRRVLGPDGVVGITDLCTVGEDRRAPPGSPNVFRSGELLVAMLEAHGVRITERWTAPADLETSWDDVGRRVDEEIARRFGDEPAYESWRADRAGLRDQIRSGALVVETIVGTVVGGRSHVR